MPMIEAYDSLFDPTNHLWWYIAQMEITRANDPIMLKAFSSTLKGDASTFLCYFMGSQPLPKTVHHLLKVWQHKDESLQDYIQRFQAKSIQVQGLTNDMKLLAVTQGFQRESRLAYNIKENLVAIVAKFIDRASKLINSEKLNSMSHHPSSSSADRNKKCDKGTKPLYPSSATTKPSDIHPLLWETRTNIILMLEKQNKIPKWPALIQHKSSRGSNKFY